MPLDTPIAPATPMAVDTAEAFAAGLSFKVLLIDAICGVGVPTRVAIGVQGTRLLTGFPNPQWDRNELAKCRVEQLQALYEGLCEAREEENPLDGTRGGVSDHAS